MKRKYGLTKAEVLTVVNLRPGELSVLNAIVEECEGRFGEEAQGGILRDVEGWLGRGEVVVDGGGEVGTDGGEGVEGSGGGVNGRGEGDVEMGGG